MYFSRFFKHCSPNYRKIPYPKNTNSQLFWIRISTVLCECVFIMLTVNLIMKTMYISLKQQF